MKQPQYTTCKTHSFLHVKPYPKPWEVQKTWTHINWRVLVKTSIYIVNNWQWLILTRITWLKSRLIYIKQFIFFSKLKNWMKNNSFKYFLVILGISLSSQVMKDSLAFVLRTTESGILELLLMGVHWEVKNFLKWLAFSS